MTSLDWLVSMLITEAVREQLLTRELLPRHRHPEVRAAALEVWERGWAMRCPPSGWAHRRWASRYEPGPTRAIGDDL